MNAAIAIACWVTGSSGNGRNQTAAGTTTQAARPIHCRCASCCAAALVPSAASRPPASPALIASLRASSCFEALSQQVECGDCEHQHVGGAIVIAGLERDDPLDRAGHGDAGVSGRVTIA